MGEERYGQTDIHPVALALTLAMCVAMLVVRRDRTVLPLLIVACFVTHAQRIVIAGLDFSMLRIVLLFGWARVISRGETGSYRFHPLDRLLPLWILFGILPFLFGPRASMSTFVWRLGHALDAAGMYFLFRVVLRDIRDVRRTVEAFGLLALLMAGPMALENLTGRNLFSALGGVPEITNIRDGRLRCQAAFSHPIMVGNFGATSAALLIGLWLAYPRQRVRHTAALLGAVLVTAFSNSSGPLMVLLTGWIGWAMWPLRRYMRQFRWATSILLIVIHFAREKPVWHLIGRLSSITGGTGYHRVMLMNNFFADFKKWWLFGGSASGWPSTDITNQYILEGLRGGLATLVLFIAMLVEGFRTAGRSAQRALASASLPRQERRPTALLAWALGVALAGHCMGFMGVSYFGQLQSILYLHLAMIPSLACALSRAESRSQQTAPEAAAKAQRSQPGRVAHPT